MKFSVVAAVAASAALASASPLRVIVVSSNVNAVAEPNNPFAKVRFGHAVHDPNVAQIMEGPNGWAPDARLPFPPPPHHPHRKPMPCAMRRPGGLRQKAIDISNAFRKTFGLPLIETDLEYTPIVHGPGGKEIHGGMVHIMPFIGTETGDKEPHPYGWSPGKIVHIIPPPELNHPGGGPHHHHPPPPPFFPPPPPPPHRHHGHHGHHHHGFQIMQLDDSFMVRLQNALMSLGPWEGRAVAFVVGAGLGVLLRMIWVLGVVAYRGCSNDREYSAIANDDDSDDDDDDDNVVLGTRFNRRTPISAPPSYVYPVDEKVRIEEEATPVTVIVPEVQKSPAPAPAAGNN